MTVNKILTVCLICLALLKVSYSQVKSAAVLVDEFEDVPCNEYWARLDGLFIELEKDPFSRGYVVIYGKENELIRNLGYEGWSNGIINWNKSYKTRIEVVRGGLGGQRKIQFWKVPLDTAPPAFRKANWSYSLPASTEPFIFWYSRGLDKICPSAPSLLKNYTDLILANPAARGHLVIRAGTKKQMLETEKEVLGELVNKYRLPRNRLKLFYVREKQYRVEKNECRILVCSIRKNKSSVKNARF